MRIFLVSLICVVGLGACTAMTDDQTQTGSIEDAIVLNRAAGLVSKDCEGYTSGGGQRVRGHVQMAFVPSSDTPGLWRVRVEAWAQNWKKNFGWNTKRTAELRIAGSTTLVQGGVGNPPPRVPNVPDCVFDADTGGEQETTIDASCEFSADVVAGTLEPGVNTALSFFGRDGTVCSI